MAGCCYATQYHGRDRMAEPSHSKVSQEVKNNPFNGRCRETSRASPKTPSGEAYPACEGQTDWSSKSLAKFVVRFGPGSS